jgi:hypothetical protein
VTQWQQRTTQTTTAVGQMVWEHGIMSMAWQAGSARSIEPSTCCLLMLFCSTGNTFAETVQEPAAMLSWINITSAMCKVREGVGGVSGNCRKYPSSHLGGS